MKFVIKAMRQSDWEAVSAIYGELIAAEQVLFETDAPSWEHWDRLYLRRGRLVARAVETRRIVAWGALSGASDLLTPVGVATVTLQLTGAVQGMAVGRSLLLSLIDESEYLGLWTLQAGVFTSNKLLLDLYKSCDFREVGLRERIGQINGHWQDVLLLERRSKVIGI